MRGLVGMRVRDGRSRRLRACRWRGRGRCRRRLGSAELNATIERVAPDILALLADGVPRRKPAIVEALAGRHAGEDVALALVRLAVTDRVVETGGRYALASDPAPDAG